MVVLFKNIWKKWQTNALGFAVFFVILFAAIRAVGMLGPRSLGPLIPLGFVTMMVLPFIFLTAEGRRQVGLKKSNSPISYIIAVFFGAAAASVCFVVGILLFDNTPDNWFVTIRNYYETQVPGGMNMPLSRFFIIVTIPALIFSPIGEEIFFRGLLQDTLQTRFSLRTSMIIESAIFGLVHLCHHGLVRSEGDIAFYPRSGMLWVVLMFLTAYGFAMLRKQSGSIYPSIVAHAVFNLLMNVYIFSVLI
jgi:membrane protease YdiL (CAAX protease family)